MGEHFPASVKILMMQVHPEWTKHFSHHTPGCPLLIRPAPDGEAMLVPLPMPRQLWRAPFASVVEEHVESLLVVDLNGRGPGVVVTEPGLSLAFDQAIHRTRNYQTLHILSITTDFRVSLLDLIRSIPAALRDEVHTLHLADLTCRPRLQGPVVTLVGSLTPEDFPKVRVLVLEINQCTTFLELGHAFPLLRSLQVTDTSVSGWEHMSVCGGLQDLCVLAQQLLFSQDLMTHLSHFTHLRRLMLSGGRMPPQQFRELQTLRDLHSLSLLVPNLYNYQLDQLAQHLQQLRVLHLNSREVLVLPENLSELCELIAPDSTVMNSAFMIVNLAMLGTDSPNLNPNLVPDSLQHLCVCYHQLSRYVGCPKLLYLHLQLPTSEFWDTQQAALMDLLRQGTCWEQLQTLIILPSVSDIHAMTDGEVIVNHGDFFYVAEMLQVLASRPRQIKHATLMVSHDTESSELAVEALCDMPSLCSVTLAAVKVSMTQLRRLANLPHMRVVELIAVSGISGDDVEAVRGEHKYGPIRLLWRDLSALTEMCWSPSKIYWQSV